MRKKYKGMKNERKVVHKEDMYTPNNSQPTNFVMVDYTLPHSDEMQFSRASEYMTMGNESCCLGIRKPY